jgi:ribosome-binding protein aMBF1 (putative translation factor)
MINEQLAPTEKPITALPNNRTKAKESLEIAALTAEFLARGGQIKRVKGNQLHVAMNPLAQDIWPNREKVLKIFKEKKIKASDMSRRFKKSQQLITQWLTGARTPDNEERVKLERLVKEWV